MKYKKDNIMNVFITGEKTFYHKKILIFIVNNFIFLYLSLVYDPKN